jgi:hypothetical protein
MCPVKTVEEEWHLNPSLTLIAEAAALDKFSRDAGSLHLENVLARASITYAAIFVESVAHACSRHLDGCSNQLLDGFERMSTIDKFDLLVWSVTSGRLDRGSSHVQRIQDLIRIRNDLVHSKVVRRKVRIHPGADGQSAALERLKGKAYEALHIPGNPYAWTRDHSAGALRATCEFVDWFLVDVCRLPPQFVSGLLCSSSPRGLLINDLQRAGLKILRKERNISLRCLVSIS